VHPPQVTAPAADAPPVAQYAADAVLRCLRRPEPVADLWRDVRRCGAVQPAHGRVEVFVPRPSLLRVGFIV
jgi:hypothetical protein